MSEANDLRAQLLAGDFIPACEVLDEIVERAELAAMPEWQEQFDGWVRVGCPTHIEQLERAVTFKWGYLVVLRTMMGNLMEKQAAAVADLERAQAALTDAKNHERTPAHE